MRSVRTPVLAFLLAVLPNVAAAQLSPGPLSHAHQKLEGVKNCLQCHGLGESSVDSRCLECHREIGWLREEKRGLHGHADGPGREAGCAECHREHSGRDFAIIHWNGNDDFDSFDHSGAGWLLDGKHAETQCRDCHRPELHTTEFPDKSPWSGGKESWLGLESDCVACHRDPHEGRLSTRCADCHDTADFRTISEKRFDHEVTRYPLRGAHADVACAQCHERSGGTLAMPAFERCDSCHDDPHAGQTAVANVPRDCDECHTDRYFRPSTLDRRFHATTNFPLDDQHAPVDCARCHRDERERFGSAAFEFRPKGDQCSDCHDDSHGSQLTNLLGEATCARCHAKDHFRPSTFTVADHEQTRFPLREAHRSPKCQACHGPDRPGLPALPGRKALGTAGVLLQPEFTECTACHADPHRGRFGAQGETPVDGGCQACHGEDSFRRVRMDQEMHAGFGFALTGAHGAIACFECHAELRGDRLRSTLLLSAASDVHLPFTVGSACIDCHEDPHARQFENRAAGAACDTCHDSDSFVGASRFVHNRDSTFELAGAHERVACSGCHPEIVGADGRRSVRYLPTPTRCEDCHATPPPAVVPD